MYALICFFLLFHISLHAKQPSLMSGWEKLSQSNSHPSIDACGTILGVNVMTGSYHESSLDFVSKGIDPIHVERSYFRDALRTNLYAELDCPNALGWYLNYDNMMCMDGDQFIYTGNIFLASLSGSFLHFERPLKFRFFYVSSLKGFMNDSSALLSGQTHWKNARIVENNKLYEIHYPDGTLAYFPMSQKLVREVNVHQVNILSKRNPTGSTVVWVNGNPMTKGPDGTILNWMRIESKNRSLPVTIETSDNRTFAMMPSKGLFRVSGITTFLTDRFVYPDGSFIKYYYKDHPMSGNDFFTGKDVPGGGYLRVHYDKKNRVERLEMPGALGVPVTAYYFAYGDFYTIVLDVKRNLTRYDYDINHRITKISKHEGSTCIRVEKNVWDGDGCLLAKILMDPHENPYLARCFEYDAKCNVICEKFYGNLTGSGQVKIILGPSGLPIENGCECSIMRYSYSQDDFNLLLSESNGVSRTEYSYKPQSNLLIKKLVYDEKDEIRLRQFRSYDGMGALSLLIEDDGSTQDPDCLVGCTIRKIKKIRNRKEFPGVGQPEEIQETYYDFHTSEEKSLTKTIYHYNKHNECIQEDVYDAFGEFRYAIKRSFDLMGRCVYETDPMGNEVFRTFDIAGNVISESGPLPNVVIENGYDVSNRKVWTRQKDETGTVKEVRFQYDHAGACIAKWDERGNQTTYTCDGFGRKIQEIHPPTREPDGSLKGKSIFFRYDLTDHIVESCDEEGGHIFIEYNARSQPIHVKKITQEGLCSEEFYLYDLFGNCLQKISPNGSLTKYTYDFLDRIVAEEIYDKKGEKIAETSASYNSFVKISETDSDGVSTYIEYDGAGREIKITKGSSCIEKGYDALGFVAFHKEWHSEDGYLLKKFTRDVSGQMIEESVEENGFLHFKKTFQFNALRKPIKVTTYSSLDSPEDTYIDYDGFGREIKKTDPLSHVWTTEYRDDVLNSMGQRCSLKKEMDPNGNITETLYDARGRPAVIKKFDCDGNEVLHRECFYDGLGNCVLIKEGGIETRFSYDGKKQIKIVENANCDQSRTTFMSYNASGELIRKETPLTIQEFSYDGLGKMITHQAVLKEGRGNKIERSYSYSMGGKLTSVHQNGKQTDREYDLNGRLTWEKQESGLWISYKYDRLGRRKRLQLPNHTSLEYEYCGPFLKSITKWDASGKKAYTHTYERRNLSGKIISMQLAGSTVPVCFAYDASGKLTSLQGPYWGQRVTYDPSGNMVEASTRDCLGINTEYYAYTALNQLSKENGVDYEYDGQHNRLDGEIGNFNQLLSKGEIEFCWNEEGCLIAELGSNSFCCTYDPLGRMVSYQKTKYEYDGLDRRIYKDGKTFLYDGANEIGLYSEKGELLEFRMLGEGKGAEIGATVVIEVGKNAFSVISDIRGSIVALLELKSGRLSEIYRYTAFGERTLINLDKKASGNSWRYLGKREDEESGLVFFGRRFYYPSIGRFISPDPLGFADGPNLYAFVHNNPLTHFDLYGLYDSIQPMGSRSLGDFGSKVFHFAMCGLEWVGQNLIPIPGIRDAVEGIGRGLSGGHFFDVSEYRKNGAQILAVGTKKIPGQSNVVMNGMLNSTKEAVAFAQVISSFLDGAIVHLVYNNTWGFLSDILQCAPLKYGAITAVERKFVELIRSLAAEHPHDKINIFLHSKAGLHFDNASKLLIASERQAMNIFTFGTAKIIPLSGFNSTSNYISKFDFVSLTDTFSYVHALFSYSSNVKFLSPSSFNPLKEHFILGDTYKEAIEGICKDLFRSN